jgi:hypothetical protein
MSAAELPTASMMGWVEGSAPPRQGPSFPYGATLWSALTRLSGQPERFETGQAAGYAARRVHSLPPIQSAGSC